MNLLCLVHFTNPVAYEIKKSTYKSSTFCNVNLPWIILHLKEFKSSMCVELDLCSLSHKWSSLRYYLIIPRSMKLIISFTLPNHRDFIYTLYLPVLAFSDEKVDVNLIQFLVILSKNVWTQFARSIPRNMFADWWLSYVLFAKFPSVDS